MVATVLICRRLEGDSYVPHFVVGDSYEDLRMIATFLFCRRLEGESYVPHLSKTCLWVVATFLICRLEGEGSSWVVGYGPHLSKA